MTPKFDKLLGALRENGAGAATSSVRRKVITFDEYANIGAAITALGIEQWSVGATLALQDVGPSGPLAGRRVLTLTERAANGSSVHTGLWESIEVLLALPRTGVVLQDLAIELGDVVRVTIGFCIFTVTQYGGADASSTTTATFYNQKEDWRGLAAPYWAGDPSASCGIPQIFQQYGTYVGGVAWTLPLTDGQFPISCSYDTPWSEAFLVGGEDYWVEDTLRPTVVLSRGWRENQLGIAINSVTVEVL